MYFPICARIYPLPSGDLDPRVSADNIPRVTRSRSRQPISRRYRPFRGRDSHL